MWCCPLIKIISSLYAACCTFLSVNQSICELKILLNMHQVQVGHTHIYQTTFGIIQILHVTKMNKYSINDVFRFSCALCGQKIKAIPLKFICVNIRRNINKLKLIWKSSIIVRVRHNKRN